MTGSALVQHEVVLYRTGGHLTQLEYYAGNHHWSPERSEAKLLEEDYAASLARGLHLKHPELLFETIAV